MADAGNTVVLVADADVRILQDVSSILEKAGFTVKTAANAGTVLEAVARHGDAIRLFIVDTALAGSSPELISDMHRAFPAIRFLFTSTGNLDSRHPVLVKPFRRSQLLGQVLKALDAEPGVRAQGSGVR